MFCTNCGKEIIDTARFCNYCGRPVANIAPPPPPFYPSQGMGQPYIPAPGVTTYGQSNTVINSETAENTVSGTFDAFSENSGTSDPNVVISPNAAEPDTPFPDPMTSGAAAETDNISQQASFSAEANPYPTPGNIPKSGGAVSGAYSMPTPDTTVNISAAPPSPEPKRERKYTLGHILLCLASTAIMAIAAGVFAGLYFSVV